MRNSTRKTVESRRDTGIGGVEVTITVQYPATPGGALEAADHLRHASTEILDDLAGSTTEIPR